jgi:hypothetical protein
MGKRAAPLGRKSQVPVAANHPGDLGESLKRSATAWLAAARPPLLVGIDCQVRRSGADLLKTVSERAERVADGTSRVPDASGFQGVVRRLIWEAR